jgi:hypothetical protein
VTPTGRRGSARHVYTTEFLVTETLLPLVRYKGYVYRTRIWQSEAGGQWSFNVSLQKDDAGQVKRASGLVREFQYFNDEVKAAAAAKLWAENYIDCVERDELHPW